MSWVLRTVALFVSFFLMMVPASAKRAAPSPVTPVVVGSVEYSVSNAYMGYVIATDINSRQQLWRKRIYTVRYNPFLESDVQDVFIKMLAVSRGALIITNEQGHRYSLDLVTYKVTRLLD